MKNKDLDNISYVSNVYEKIDIINTSLMEILEAYIKNSDYFLVSVRHKLDIKRLNSQLDTSNEIYLMCQETLESKSYLDKYSGVVKEGDVLVYQDIPNNYIKKVYFTDSDVDVEGIGKVIWAKMYNKNLFHKLIDILYKQEDILDYYENHFGTPKQTIDNISLYDNILYDFFEQIWHDIYHDVSIGQKIVKVLYQINIKELSAYIKKLNDNSEISIIIDTDVDRQYNYYTYDVALYKMSIGSALDIFNIKDNKEYLAFIGKVKDISDINIVIKGRVDGLTYMRLLGGYIDETFRIKNANALMIANENILSLGIDKINSDYFSINTNKLNIKCLW